MIAEVGFEMPQTRIFVCACSHLWRKSEACAWTEGPADGISHRERSEALDSLNARKSVLRSGYEAIIGRDHMADTETEMRRQGMDDTASSSCPKKPTTSLPKFLAHSFLIDAVDSTRSCRDQNQEYRSNLELVGTPVCRRRRHCCGCARVH